MGRHTTERQGPPGPPRDHAEPHFEIVSDGLHDGLVERLEPGRPVRFGRSLAMDVVIPDQADGVSREHASLERLPDGQVELRDLDSRNGTFLDGERVTRALVPDGGRIQLGVDVKLRVLWLTEEEARHRQGRFLDDLTGCRNRRRFDIALHDERGWAAELRRPLSLVIFDVDHFKAFNTEHGFPCGDAVLRAVGHCLAERAPAGAPVHRLGGEEFGLLLPGRGPEEAAGHAERLREAVEGLVVEWEGAALGVTVSAGCAGGVPEPGAERGRLLAAADAALRRAKARGRNRVEFEAGSRAEEAATDGG